MPLASLPAQISAATASGGASSSMRSATTRSGRAATTRRSRRARGPRPRCSGSWAATRCGGRRGSPTLAQPDREIDDYVANWLRSTDANDHLYALESSLDYDPVPGSRRLRRRCGRRFGRRPHQSAGAADPREGDLARTKGRAIIFPLSDRTAGHGTHTPAAMWKNYLVELLRETER